MYCTLSVALKLLALRLDCYMYVHVLQERIQDFNFMLHPQGKSVILEKLVHVVVIEYCYCSDIVLV